MAHFSVDALNQRMAQLQRSPEFQANCQRFSQECARLEIVAKELYARREQLQIECHQNTVRKEYAFGSTLHRGFYCPSPTYDLIVGNTKRGRRLKKFSATLSPSHEYGFSADGKLLYCKWLTKGSVVMTEYLEYSENVVHGILLSNDGYISTVTEETYANGKLIQYLYALCRTSDNSFFCQDISCEEYEYDEDGLCSCAMHTLTLPLQDPPDFLKELILPFMRQPIYRGDFYRFERKDGYLSAYTSGQHTYRINVRRKA
jgi:hypothetical protein